MFDQIVALHVVSGMSVRQALGFMGESHMLCKSVYDFVWNYFFKLVRPIIINNSKGFGPDDNMDNWEKNVGLISLLTKRGYYSE